jgi:hypothetical protein
MTPYPPPPKPLPTPIGRLAAMLVFRTHVGLGKWHLRRARTLQQWLCG